MASIFKRKRDRQRKGASWYFAYSDADGVRRTVKGCPDKAATESMARKLESEAELRRRGVIDPRSDAYAAHAARPLEDHLADWHASLIAKGYTAKHTAQSTDRVRRLVAVMFGAAPEDIDGKTMTRPQQKQARLLIADSVTRARLIDLSADRVQGAMATFRDSGRSLQTCNHYRACVRAFVRWAWKDGRLRENTLIGLDGFNARKTAVTTAGRSPSMELRRLIEAAESRPRLPGHDGPGPALCYRLAVATGLRYSEIASIAPESFDWKAPSVTVAAAYTKNGDPATLPLPSGPGGRPGRLRRRRGPRGRPSSRCPTKGAEMLRPDLDAAGIPYRDASGLFFDFHSLRCETATLAERPGSRPASSRGSCGIDPGIDRPLYPAPRRRYRCRRRDAAQPQARPETGPRRAAMTGTDGPLPLIVRSVRHRMTPWNSARKGTKDGADSGVGSGRNSSGMGGEPAAPEIVAQGRI